MHTHSLHVAPAATTFRLSAAPLSAGLVYSHQFNSLGWPPLRGPFFADLLWCVYTKDRAPTGKLLKSGKTEATWLVDNPIQDAIPAVICVTAVVGIHVP